MAIIKESIDLNGDGEFSTEDLDICWAYLQTKALHKAGGGITVDNFISTANSIYDANKASAIAGASDQLMKRLPGYMKDGADVKLSKTLKYKKLWMFNDITEDEYLLDSITRTKSSTYTGCSWITKPGVSTLPLFNTTSNGKVDLDDQGDIRSDRDWTLYIKGTTRWSGAVKRGPIFNKGTFIVKFFTQKIDLAELTRVAVISSGVPKESIRNFFDLPVGTTANDYADTTLEISVIREGISIRLFLNQIECFMALPSEQPEPVFGESATAPVTIQGKMWKTIETVYISDIDFTGQDVLDTQNTYTGFKQSYSLAHDMDITNSFFAYKQFFPDVNGKWSQVLNSVYGGGEDAQAIWSVQPTLNQTSTGYTPKAKCLRLSTNGNKREELKIPSVNMTGDFTIAMWVSVPTGGPFITFEGVSKTLTGGFHSDLATGQEWFWEIDSKKYKRGFDLQASDDELNKWHHVTIVKNGDNIGLWSNGSTGTWTHFPLTDEQQNDLGGCTVKINSPTNKSVDYIYISHVRVLPYAISHIPIANVGMRSSWTFIDELQAPVESPQL